MRDENEEIGDSDDKIIVKIEREKKTLSQLGPKT